MSKNDNAFALLERFSRIVDENVALMRKRDPSIARQLEAASALPSISEKKRGTIGRFGSSINIGMGLTAVLCSGWSAPETWGNWSDGDRASLRLSIPPNCAFPIYVSLEVNAYLNKSGNQRISIRVGSRKAGSFSFDQSVSTRSIVLKLRASDVRESYIEVVLHVHSPISQIELGRSKDARRLGVALTTIRTESVASLQREFSTAWVFPFRGIRALGDRLTGGGLRALGNRFTGGGIRALLKRIAEKSHVFVSEPKS